jgi:hypothetical protein
MNTFSSAMIYFASSALALNLHLEEGFTSPIDASGDWTIAGPEGLEIKCVVIESEEATINDLSCVADGMTAEGFVYGYDNYINLYADSYDGETGEGVSMSCNYYGDLETMEFDSSTCKMDVWGPDYNITFMCFDQECEEYVYDYEEYTNGEDYSYTDEETYGDYEEEYEGEDEYSLNFGPKQGLLWNISGPYGIEINCI